MNWTPPEDAEVSNSGWTPPEDAIPVDSKKNESSVGSLTGSENTTPLQSTSTSEIPTVQITDGEIDAAPLNRPSTMPYGTKMGEDGKVMSDTRDINPTQREEAKKAVSKLNIQKRAEMLSAAAAKTFQENPELFSDLNNVKAYVDRVTKNYSPQDRSVIREELYKVDPRFSEERKKQLIDNAITNGIDPTGGFATGAVEGAVEGVSHGAQQIAKSTKDFTRLSMSPAKNVGEVANAVTGELAGGTQLAMGAANLFVPELAAFTIGSKAAEEKAPGISNILAPVSYLVSKHYQDKGEQAPEWASNLGALGDLILPILLGVGGKKIAEKFKDKPITPELIQEVIDETPPEEIGAAIDKFSEDHGELFKQNDVAMEEANNLSSQAETLKADLEKAKGTPAEPIIAQKIEELNTKIDEIHGKEVEKQTAEAHTLSTLDHLQKQREQLVATQESLSPEGQKAIEPEIKKVDEMIKEIEPKEEVKETVPDNEVKEGIEEMPAEDPHESVKTIADAFNSIPAKEHRKNPGRGNRILTKLREMAAEVPGMEVVIKPGRGRNKVSIELNGKRINRLDIQTTGEKKLPPLTKEEEHKAFSHEPADTREAVLQYFIGGGKISAENFNREVFNKGTTEHSERLWAIDHGENKALSGKSRNNIDDIVHHIADVMHEDFQDSKFSDAVRNDVIDVLMDHSGKKSMFDELTGKEDKAYKDALREKRGEAISELDLPEDIAEGFSDEEIIDLLNDKRERAIVDGLNEVKNDDVIVEDIYNNYADENGNIDFNKLDEDIKSGKYKLSEEIKKQIGYEEKINTPADTKGAVSAKETKGKQGEVNPDSGEITSINDALSDSKDYTGIKESVKESDANKFREIQETTSEAVKQKRMDNLSPEELHIEKNYGEIIKQLKASGLLEGPCI